MGIATAVRRPHASYPELSGAYSAALLAGGDCLRDGPVGRVGIELEAHCFDLSDLTRRPSWDELSAAVESVPPLPGGSAITMEPGGAIELSGPPLAGAGAAVAAMQADQVVVREALRRRGLGLIQLGVDPLRPQARVNPGGRYRAMEAFFAAGGTGAAGAAMMTSTASLQLNLDAGPRDGWADRVRLAHALGPTMIAVSASSPMLGGEFTGWQSSRQRIWGQLDTARCGPILGASGDDPASDWARYALKAPVMLVHTPEAEPVTEWVPFADWADGLTLLGGRRPTEADLAYHLTTLFPPVRPRGWLEIRYLDAVSDDLWPAVVFTLVAMLDDARLSQIAWEATESVATAWDQAARVGLADPRLQAAAQRCVEAAADVAPAELAGAMERLRWQVEHGRSAADDFADQVVGHGIDSALTGLALGDRLKGEV
ncbi:ergothioneine biosynthesis glutamate--cysteine ligase EgtA [Mycobacterium sp. CBMA 234]|uniref:ergothioneine biosynthesis glutamate--cysteine ligase EgtA n=1 Tax=Mycolicibacterium sp. CBMA 234 TaxID=1918495 RepID=UPI0012DCD84C|nr:ergothioneine biosynthesis glutamate--cysteine ligase EgtA [Mycolicibacterium sp. CBMA 234]MUL64750.1 ergothioneine biosynthesis glutamate--cysteine ligase EgtA [Mycolicibacterium sp. CBMA 234]